MTRERIEDMREVVLPFVKKRLLETNYENLGESDAEEFAKDFNEILNLAIKTLAQEPTTKNDCAEQNGCISCSLDDGDDCCRKLFEESMQEPTTKNDLADDKTFYEQIVEYCNEHFLVLVEKDVWKDAEKALTTKNDLAVDCISRADAIKAMQNKAKKLKNEDTINGLCGAVAILYEMPPVTPIRPKGHWKLVQRGKSIDVCCSNCEAVRIKEYAYNYTIDELDNEDINECFGSAEMRFCPNCGSRNEVEE